MLVYQVNWNTWLQLSRDGFKYTFGQACLRRNRLELKSAHSGAELFQVAGDSLGIGVLHVEADHVLRFRENYHQRPGEPVIHIFKSLHIPLDALGKEQLVRAGAHGDELQEIGFFLVFELHIPKFDFGLLLAAVMAFEEHGFGRLADLIQPLGVDLLRVDFEAIQVVPAAHAHLEFEAGGLAGAGVVQLESPDGDVAPGLGPLDDEAAGEVDRLDQVGLARGVGPVDDRRAQEVDIVAALPAGDNMAGVLAGLAGDHGKLNFLLERQEILDAEADEHGNLYFCI